MSGRLAGRCAIVTGGMRGIGRAIAVTLASEGAHVGVVDLDPPDTAAVTGLMQEIQATGSRGCYERCDVTRRDQVEVTRHRGAYQQFARGESVQTGYTAV